jgi:hypothetical protein
MVKGEAVRYLIICSTEERFKRAWNRYEQSMGNRGYSKEWLRAKRQVEREDRDKYLSRYKEEKEDKRIGSIPLLIERRPGTEAWWGSILANGLHTGYTGDEVESNMMPKSIYKIERSTASLKGLMKGLKR